MKNTLKLLFFLPAGSAATLKPSSVLLPTIMVAKTWSMSILTKCWEPNPISVNPSIVGRRLLSKTPSGWSDVSSRRRRSLIWLPKNNSNALKPYLTRGHENASITKRPMKFWAHVLHFAIECSIIIFVIIYIFLFFRKVRKEKGPGTINRCVEILGLKPGASQDEVTLDSYKQNTATYLKWSR